IVFPLINPRYRKYRSVKVNPRPFSGREVRQGSSGPAGGTRRIDNCTGFGSYFGFGSNGCWQVFRIVSTFISARSPTYDPAAEWRGWKDMLPSSATSTRLKKFTLAIRSRGPKPHLPISTRKLSRPFL